MKKVLVTGAGGFVGSHLLPLLLNKGFKVGVLVKKVDLSKIKSSQVEIIVGDLSKRDNWTKKIGDFDIIIHLAAQISSKKTAEFTKNNVIATKNLMESLRGGKVKKIILFSSAAVTSIRKDAYAETKLEKENLVRSSGINYIILRPSMIYGPGDTKNIGWLISFINKYPIVPLPGGGHFGRQPIFVEDLCQVVVKLISTSKILNKVYEIHGFEYVTMKRMIDVITKNLKSKKIIFPIPILLLKFTFWIGQVVIPNPKFTVDQINSLVSGEKFKGDKWWELFNIKVTKFEEGISRMIKN